MTDTTQNGKLCPDLPIKKIATPTSSDLHACMGLNSCKNNDIFGDNSCAGRGYCATAVPHVCKTMNECAGQGGCGLFGSVDEQCTPGENSCKYQGTCATPIQAERFSTDGPNAKMSVWVLARKRFEDRMQAENKEYGDAPCQYGPPQQWLDEVYANDTPQVLCGSSGGVKTYDSCGSSGDKRCSYGYNDADSNTRAMVEKSKDSIKTTIKNCDCK
jgi:hypothetical protein